MVILWHDIIPKIRRKLNLSQAELAEKLHFPNRGTIAHWERGKGRRPHGETIEKIRTLCKENGFTLEDVAEGK